jgi:D-alanyl-D-alanine carboxypeptidase/D-alanyl-D-alanine-endopeptidase (penicillin-binding protein 4)
VKNIGGYVKNKAGAYYSVVILVNTRKGTFRAVQLQDSIINWLAQSTKTPSEDSSKSVPSKTVKVYSPPVVKAEPKQVSHVSQKNKPSSGSYYIQVVSVTKKPDSHYLSKIEKEGFSYKVVHEKNYKVLIGGYSSKESAQKALPKVRQKFSKGAFIVTR